MRAFIPLAVTVTALTAYLAFLPERSGTVGFWVLAVAPAVVLGTAAAAWGAREEFLGEWLRPRWGVPTGGVLGALGLYGFAWLSARAFAPVGSRREIWLVSAYAQLGDPRVLQAHAPAVALAVVCAAAAEELTWRGAITQLLAARVGSRFAWLWAAALYALAFTPTAVALGGSAGPDPAVVAVALAGGLVWGGMARSFGGLLPSIIAHALFVWGIVMMFPLWGGRQR